MTDQTHLVKLDLENGNVFETATRFPMEQRILKEGRIFMPRPILKISTNPSINFQIWIRFEPMGRRLTYRENKWKPSRENTTTTDRILGLGTFNTLSHSFFLLDFRISSDKDCSAPNTVYLKTRYYYQPVICIAPVEKNQRGVVTLGPTSEFVFLSLGFIGVHDIRNMNFWIYKQYLKDLERNDRKLYPCSKNDEGNDIQSQTQEPERKRLPIIPWIESQPEICSLLIQKKYYQPSPFYQFRGLLETEPSSQSPEMDLEEVNLIEDYWNLMHEIQNMGYFPNRVPQKSEEPQLESRDWSELQAIAQLY